MGLISGRLEEPHASHSREPGLWWQWNRAVCLLVPYGSGAGPDVETREKGPRGPGWWCGRGRPGDSAESQGALKVSQRGESGQEVKRPREMPPHVSQCLCTCEGHSLQGRGQLPWLGALKSKRVEEIKRSGRGEPISVDQQGLLHPPDLCCVKEARCAVTRRGPCGSWFYPSLHE